MLGLVIGIVGFLCAPFVASRIMGKAGGMGKSATVALIVFGCLQLFGFVAPILGPLGGVLHIMSALAAWYVVVRVIYGTDRAETIVFVFWNIFFLLLAISVAVAIGQSQNALWVLGL